MAFPSMAPNDFPERRLASSTQTTTRRLPRRTKASSRFLGSEARASMSTARVQSFPEIDSFVANFKKRRSLPRILAKRLSKQIRLRPPLGRHLPACASPGSVEFQHGPAQTKAFAHPQYRLDLDPSDQHPSRDERLGVPATPHTRDHDIPDAHAREEVARKDGREKLVTHPLSGR